MPVIYQWGQILGHIVLEVGVHSDLGIGIYPDQGKEKGDG